MKYALSTLAENLREIAAKDEKFYGGPTKESEVIKQAAKVVSRYDKESKQNAVYVCFVGNGPEARRQTAFSIRDLCVKKTETDAIAWFRKQYRTAGEVLDSKADISDDFIRNSLRTTGEYHATVFADIQNNWEDCYDLNIQKKSINQTP